MYKFRYNYEYIAPRAYPTYTYGGGGLRGYALSDHNPIVADRRRLVSLERIAIRESGRVRIEKGRVTRRDARTAREPTIDEEWPLDYLPSLPPGFYESEYVGIANASAAGGDSRILRPLFHAFADERFDRTDA